MTSKPDAIADLIIAHVPRNLMMGVEDAFDAGALLAHHATKDLDHKHRKNALGQMRHFHMNERFSESLQATGTEYVPLKGNGVVVGQAGMFKFSRLNMSTSAWNNASRSATRRELSEANQAMTQLLQPSLFGPQDITTGTFFFVARFSGSLQHQPEKALEIYVAVPDAKMEGWLFREPLHLFLERYDRASNQMDRAKPKLKAHVIESERDKET